MFLEFLCDTAATAADATLKAKTAAEGQREEQQQQQQLHR